MQETIVKVPLPPYAYEANAVSILYPVSPEIVRQRLPEPFSPFLLGGKALFEVMFIQYEKAVSLVQPDEDFSYLEVGYSTYVLFGGKKGNYYFKMYLSDQVELGKVIYRCPKYPAEISIERDRNGRSLRVEREGGCLLEAQVEIQQGMVPRLIAGLIKAYLQLTLRKVVTYTYSRERTWVTEASFPIQGHEENLAEYFLPSERTLVTQAPWSIRGYSIRLAKLRRATFKEPVEWGFLSPAEIREPKLVLAWEPILFEVGKPQMSVL